MHRAARLFALLPLLLAATASADEPVSTAVWKSRGSPALHAALARAKAAKKQVLVALPGGDGCCGDVAIDQGPIAAGLEKEPFLAFAAARETVLIEPPEGALVARAYKVERPGLLLLDGDGRWLAAVALPSAGGADVAGQATTILRAAAAPSAAASLRIVLSGGTPSDAQVAGLASLPGVLDAAREGGAVVVTGVVEAVDPNALVAALASGGASPTPSHAIKRWKLAGLEKSKAGLAMLRAPLGIRGVHSVRPDRPNKVVALLVDATFDEEALNAAWKEAYAEATPIP